MEDTIQPQSLADEVQEHLIDVVVRATGGQIHRETVSFDAPPKPDQGDIAFRCFGVANVWKRDVNKVATDLAEAFQPTEFVERAIATGPYLNFFLNRSVIATKLLNAVLAEQETYGSTDTAKPETIVVEYISGNTNKPLHLGHLRNGLLGWSVAELLRAQGHDVIKTDIVNDRGIHIVKSMLAYQKWGNGETPGSAKMKPDHFVAKWYVRFDQEYQQEMQAWLKQEKIDLASMDDRVRADTQKQFRKISKLMAEAQTMLVAWEANNATVRALWKTMNDWVFAGWETTYNALGFDFDKHYYESEIYEKGKAIVDWALKDGLFVKAENGAVIVPLSKTTDLPDIPVLRADGTSIYLTQDLYLANKRFDDFHYDRSLYVIGSEQVLYMQQLFATLHLLKFPAADKLAHLSYGYVSLPEGRMKSREGTVVDADDILEEMNQLAIGAVQERYPDLAEAERSGRAKTIALAALKFHFLSVGRTTTMVFNPKESLAFEGRTGPYVQYAYARAGSILRKLESEEDVPETAVISDDREWALVMQLMQFPHIVAEAADAYDPAKLANYLVDLAQAFSSFYHELPVLKEKKEVRQTRLAVVRAVQVALKNGLALLGIGTLETM